MDRGELIEQLQIIRRSDQVSDEFRYALALNYLLKYLDDEQLIKACYGDENVAIQ